MDRSHRQGRFKDRIGKNLIECALCGEIVYSDQVRLSDETGLPWCMWHTIEENFHRRTLIIKEQQVPYPQKNPDDVFLDNSINDVYSLTDEGSHKDEPTE